MGGTAAIIRGKVDDRLLRPGPAKQGILDRILGRKKLIGPREDRMGDGRSLIELSSDDFKCLATAFENFLRQSIPQTWESTKLFFDYLSINTLSIYVRGERVSPPSEIDWYLQFSFSGCAGMAETSAELGSHWVEQWFQKEGDEIQRTILNGLGFFHKSTGIHSAGLVFVPFEGLGYGRRLDDQTSMDPEWEGSQIFEFDGALTEDLQEKEKLERFREIDKRFGDLGSDGKCLCQLCSPAFEPPRVDI